MTHSGQGDEQRLPAARPAYEGVVLPADGSEPLIPGSLGAQAAPAGGQPWGAPWGPQQSPPPPSAGDAPGAPPQPGYGYPTAPGPAPQDYATPNSLGAPGTTYGYAGVPAQGQAGGYGAAAAQGQPGYGYPGAPAPQAGHPAVPAQGQANGYGAPVPQGPPTGPGASAPQAGGPGHPGSAPQAQPGYGYPGAPVPQAGGLGHPGAPAQGQANGYGVPAPQGPPTGAAASAPQPGYGYPGAAAPQAGALGHPGAPAQGQASVYGAPAPQGPPTGPAAPAPQAGGPGHPGTPAPQGASVPLPLPVQGAPGLEELTQMLPPQGGQGGHGGPVGASDATQYIQPVAGGPATPPGALPPEMPAESTTVLGAARAGGGDSDATQYIAPVPPAPTAAPFGIRPGAPGDRQPPAEFDSLFRSDAPQAQPADSTQQLPRFDTGPGSRPAAHQQPGHAGHTSRYDDEPVTRRRSIVPVVAALVIGCAVLGLGVGAVMSGGDDDKDPVPDENVAVGTPAPSQSASGKAPDPAEPQAKELDKLLADSNNSRAAVIRSVENIKVCKNLDQAVTDLKGAAAQRRSLVTRLDGLTVDKLPDNAALTSALTKAWQASASADDHYAAWAQQVKGKKGCKDGKARVTAQTAQGNRASGEATKAKNEAAKLWNSIARTYGLTERRSEQL
ncbi:hypothetical protein ACLB9X_14780 [Streptomyces sp. 5K101]|uniref:hypothetical protein n=1 Tax=Streptomyces sp. 5K101 TaxID=3390037 RepID=UPI0039755D42